MSAKEIVRAWKNEEYLLSLNPVEASAIPENPAGNIELHNYNGRAITLHVCTEKGACTYACNPPA